MDNYLTKTAINIRTILFIGSIAFLVYVYAFANGLTLPWEGKKDDKKTVTYLKKITTPTPTATPIALSPTPASYKMPSNTNSEQNPALAGSSAAPTQNNQNVSANISVSTPNEILKQISLPKIEVQVNLPLL